MIGSFCLEELTTTEGIEFESAISIEALAKTSLRLFPKTETPISQRKQKQIKIKTFDSNKRLYLETEDLLVGFVRGLTRERFSRVVEPDLG